MHSRLSFGAVSTSVVAAGFVSSAVLGIGNGLPLELFDLLASDGAAGDAYGDSVAVSNGLAIVGAEHNDDNGLSSGSAYIFDTASGQQNLKLLPIDGEFGDLFGISVAIDNGLAIVGASLDDDNGDGSGSAYVFDSSTGQQISKLLPSDGFPGDQFGWSVAISGGTAVVGAILDDGNGVIVSGSAYLFNAVTGQQLFKILPNDSEIGDQFGYSVAISGDRVVVGSWADDDSGVTSGSAYIFDTATGQQLLKLLAADGASGDQFGFTVSINDGLVAVGANADDENGTDSGSAYVFDSLTGQQIAKLLPDDGASLDRFGASVSVHGDYCVVGSPLDDDSGSNSGSAYVFDATSGQQISKLLPSIGATGDNAGSSVAVSGSIAVVGSASAERPVVTVFDFSPCSASSDINFDGIVDTADLGILIGQFGTVGPIADINNDGAVDTADLGILIGEFGESC